MTTVLKRNGFKILEAIAEFIIYMPWMFYLYFLIFRDNAFFKFIPFLIAFVLAGLLITDYLVAKRKLVYKIAAYSIGALLAIVAGISLWIYEGPIFAVMFILYFFICYMRGLVFATHNFMVAYSQSKFAFCMGVLLITFVISLYIADLYWFGRYIIWLALGFIAVSIIILNQLQLLRILDMMNAEAYVAHKNVRFRNFIFSLFIIGVIMLIFKFKAMVRFLSALVMLAVSGLKYILFVSLRWLITWLNSLFSSSQQDAVSSIDFSQLQEGMKSSSPGIMQIIMEIVFYIVAIGAVVVIVYYVGRAIIRWISEVMRQYVVGEDEERNFIISWDDLIDRSSALGQGIQRRIKHMIRRFETPQQHVRFLYAQTIKRFEDKGCDFNPSYTPQDIHLFMSQRFPMVDPDLLDLTALYQKARYSCHDIGDEHVSRAKRYRDRLVKLKL